MTRPVHRRKGDSTPAAAAAASAFTTTSHQTSTKIMVVQEGKWIVAENCKQFKNPHEPGNCRPLNSQMLGR